MSDEKDPQRVLRMRATCERVGLSRTTIWRLAAVNGFPKPIRLGTHSVGWRASDLDAWIESRRYA